MKGSGVVTRRKGHEDHLILRTRSRGPQRAAVPLVRIADHLSGAASSVKDQESNALLIAAHRDVGSIGAVGVVVWEFEENLPRVLDNQSKVEPVGGIRLYDRDRTWLPVGINVERRRERIQLRFSLD